MDSAAYASGIDTLLTPFGGRRLSKLELYRSPLKGCVFGWEVETDILYLKKCVVLQLLYLGEPNNTLPKIIIKSPTLKPLDMPHLEESGKLCVWPERFIVDLTSPDYILELLRDACELIQEGLKGNLDNDFEAEFHNYWFYHCKSNRKHISLLDPSNTTTRTIYVKQYANTKRVYADSREDIEKFLDSQRQLPDKKNGQKRENILSRICKSVVIHFSSALVPKYYPCRAGDLFSLIEHEFSDNGEEIIQSVIAALAERNISEPAILLSFTTDNGRCLVGLTFTLNFFSQRDIRSRHQHKSITDGFRKNIPFRDAKNRTCTIPVHGNIVTRADASWIIGRDSNSERKIISDHKVILIGCGSIGSGVAKLLLKSGVENLTLLDGDSFNPENISRHELGFDSVDVSKVVALKSELSRMHPNVFITTHDLYLEPIETCREIMFSGEYDLVVSCTGNWYSNNLLLEWQEHFQVPIVFASVEAHACAGHVIVNFPDENAFKSLHFTNGSKVGQIKVPMTIWNEETRIKIPACSGEFQPYGAIDSNFLIAITAKKIIALMVEKDDEKLVSTHTLWLGSTPDLTSLGGQWNQEWQNTYCSVGSGNRVVELVYAGGKWSMSEQYD